MTRSAIRQVVLKTLATALALLAVASALPVRTESGPGYELRIFPLPFDFEIDVQHTTRNGSWRVSWQTPSASGDRVASGSDEGSR